MSGPLGLDLAPSTGPEVQLVAVSPTDTDWAREVLGLLGARVRGSSSPLDLERPAVLCVRDPRRGLAPVHDLFALPAPETWAYLNLLWAALAEGTDVLVTRLEDAQADTVTEVRRLAGFVGLAPDDAEVAHAVAATRPPAADARQRTAVVGGPVEHAMRVLGYEPGGVSPLAPRPAPAAVLAAIDVARARLATSGVEAARAALIAARQVLLAEPAARVPLVGALAALRWAETVLGADGLRSAQGGRAFDTLRALNATWAEWPPIEHALIEEEIRLRQLLERTDFGAVRAARLRAAGEETSTAARAAELFAAGNYIAVARTGPLDAWQTHAAFGLVGKAEAAAAGLARFSHPEARFYTGVAHFIAGDEERARHELETVDTEHARRLVELLRKPRIRLLTQVPWVRQGSIDYLSAAARDGRFEIRNLSFDPRDLPNEPYLDARRLVDPRDPFDFYVVALAEFHLMPPNVRALGCPILGQTADYDTHIQLVHPWLQQLDELVVANQSEWDDVQGLVAVPVSTFPKCLGVPDELPPVPTGSRDLDLLFTGTSLHPYYHEKARAVHQLLESSGARAKIINGHIWYQAYLPMLGHAKVSFAHIRRPGDVGTRALEALGMGCAVVVQRESTLSLYVGEEDGVVAYDFERGELPGAVRRILDDWPEFQARARWGAKLVRHEFAMSRVALEFLRFLTFVAARPRAPRATEPPPPEQKRGFLWKGPAIPRPASEQLMHLNLRRWVPEAEQRVTRLIDLLREIVLHHADPERVDTGSPMQERLLSSAFELAWQGVAQFPTSLVLRFDLIRSVLHCGQPKEVTAAIDLLVATLAEPAERWHVDLEEDVFPFDFAPGFFNYRDYLALVTEARKADRTSTPELVRLILASLWHYLGCYSGDPAHAERATTLDPGFASYRFSLAKRLLDTDRPDDRTRAATLLTALADGSPAFVSALELLKLLADAGVSLDPRAGDVSGRLARAHAAIEQREDQRPGTLRPGLMPGLRA